MTARGNLVKAAVASAAIVIGGTGLTGAYASLIERQNYRLRRFQVPALPPGRPGLTLLHLSDLHLMPGQRRKIAWLQRLAGQRPDFVVTTGDLVSHPKALPALARALGPLAGIPGVFVTGSNDYFGPGPTNPLAYLRERGITPRSVTLPTPALCALLESYGWDNAEEKTLTYDLGGNRVEVRGCGDAHINRDYYNLVAGPVGAGVDLVIGVTHAPYRRVLDAMVADGCGLILAGHTHGGQVCLPNGRALTTNCDLPVEQASGLSGWRYGTAEAALHVGAGLGTSPYAPYRLFCPPEATILHLTPRPGPSGSDTVGPVRAIGV